MHSPVPMQEGAGGLARSLQNQTSSSTKREGEVADNTGRRKHGGTHLMRAGVTACPSALSADTSSARPPQAQGDAMLVPATRSGLQAGVRQCCRRPTCEQGTGGLQHVPVLAQQAPSGAPSSAAAVGRLLGRQETISLSHPAPRHPPVGTATMGVSAIQLGRRQPHSQHSAPFISWRFC